MEPAKRYLSDFLILSVAFSKANLLKSNQQVFLVVSSPASPHGAKDPSDQ